MKEIYRKQNRLLIISCLLTIGIIAVLIVSAFILEDIEVVQRYYYKNNEIIIKSWHNLFAEICLWSTIILVIMNFIMLICLVIWKIKGVGKMALKFFITCVLLVATILIIPFAELMVCGFDIEWYEPEYYSFTDERHTIVICETSFGLSGWGDVFEVQQDGRAYLIGNFWTDDGLRNYGDYQIEWRQDGATIYYDNCTGSQNSASELEVSFVE